MELRSKHKRLNATKRSRKNTHTKNYMVLMLRTHLNAVCTVHMQYAYTASNCHESEGKADVISFIAIMNTHCFPFILPPSLTFSLSRIYSHLISERLAVLISFTLPTNQQTYWSALVRFGPLRAVHLAVKLEIQLFQCFQMTFAAQSNAKGGRKVKRVINLIKFQMRNMLLQKSDRTMQSHTKWETETNRMEKVAEQ